MSASRSAQRCSAVVTWARVGRPLVSASPRSAVQFLSEDQRRVALGAGCGGWGAAWARPRSARSLGVGTGLPGGAAGAGPGEEPFFAGCAAGGGGGAGVDSGSGAERIAAISGRISGRGPGGGQIPATSRARIAAVIH